MLQHPSSTTALAEQHQADLRRQAEQARLVRGGRLAPRARRAAVGRRQSAQPTWLKRLDPDELITTPE